MTQRRHLIEKILRYQDWDSLCRLSVVLCDFELEADGCSLFLLKPDIGKLVLQESTVLTRYLGKSKNILREHEGAVIQMISALLKQRGMEPQDLKGTLTSREVDRLGANLSQYVRQFGLTHWALDFCCPLLIDSVHDDVRWSHGTAKEATPTDPTKLLGLCELKPDEIGSMMVVPIGTGLRAAPRGLLRVVRRKGNSPFGKDELNWLEWLANVLDCHMQAAISLTDLMDLGTKLEIGDFGETLVELLKKVLGAKGCTIFLEMEPSEEPIRSFPCIATTGLFDESGRLDPEKFKYTIDRRKEKIDSLTGWVLRYGEHLALDSTYEYDYAQYRGMREPGPGKSSETDPESGEQPGGPILISPLFLYDKPEPVGAIRVVRPPSQNFDIHERLLLVDISRRLSKVVTNLRLRQVFEKLIKLYEQPKEMLRRVPLEVCKLLEVNGCSVLRLHNERYLRLEATAGNLEGQEGKIVYDLRQEKAKMYGWTMWVVRNKRALRLNYPEQALKLFPDDPPLHTPEELATPCEVGPGGVYRFLAVPIFQRPEDHKSKILGVIRVPRLKSDPQFKRHHLSILMSFSARLSLALNLTGRREQLRAVVEVSTPTDPREPGLKVAERAVKVLVDEVGFDFAAVYELDTRTGRLFQRWVDARRNPPPPRSVLSRDKFPSSEWIRNDDIVRRLSREGKEVVGWDDVEGEGDRHDRRRFRRFVYPIKLGSLLIGAIEAGYDITGEESELNGRHQHIRERQKYMVQILADFCSSALYNQSVLRKLNGIREGLRKVGKEMIADKSLKFKLQKIAEVAAAVTQADNVIIFEYFGPPPKDDSRTGRFRESAIGGPVEPSEWEGLDFKPDAVPFRIVSRKRPVFASDARRSKVLFHQKEYEENFIVRERLRSVAALALYVGPTCLGCMFFNFRTKQNLKDKQRREEIRLIAEYAKLAIYQVRLLEEKSSLLRFADHSLSQPLSSLVGYLDNLAAGVYRSMLSVEEITDKYAYQHSRFSRLAQQHHRLVEYVNYLIDTFLSIDRVETGLLRDGRLGLTDVFRIFPEPDTNLSDICESVKEIAEAYMEGKIRTRIESDVIGCFDSNAIKTAILNVLTNAIKYGARPGDDIRLEKIRLSLCVLNEDGTTWSEIRIDDSGSGIPEDQRESVFEMGYRKDWGFPGLGIGLYLTRGYVESHGGKVWIEDTGDPEYSGARFVLRIPTRQER